jgi:hypothetical protein
MAKDFILERFGLALCDKGIAHIVSQDKIIGQN